MTTYKRSDRRHWRYTLRRFAWRVNLLLAVLAMALVLAVPVQAQTTVRCQRGTQPGFYHPYGRTVGVCYVYRPTGVLP